MESGARSIHVLLFPGFDLLDVAGPVEVFSIANLIPAQPRMGSNVEELLNGKHQTRYRVELIAVSESRRVTSHNGIAVEANTTLSQFTVPTRLDTVIVPGGDIRAAMQNRCVLQFLRRTAPIAFRVASVCSGALVLAAAGLLDNRRATTHWLSMEDLRGSGVGIQPESGAIFVRDGNTWTSAGSTAGIDLVLKFVEEDFGRDLALMVARLMVLPVRRPGGQSQFSPLLRLQCFETAGIQKTMEWAASNLQCDLRIEKLASRSGMSPRNFARVFARELGEPPGQFVERLRVDTAQQLLEHTSLGLKLIASECGFKCTDSLRRAFQRTLDLTPTEYRSRFRY